VREVLIKRRHGERVVEPITGWTEGITPEGHAENWTGDKPYLDAADGEMPISALLTSAVLHDRQMAIPLAMMTSRPVTQACHGSLRSDG
jgi:hypothetical protein